MRGPPPRRGAPGSPQAAAWGPGRDGLVNNTVKQVEFMSDGSVWIATEGGVTHYRPGNRPPSVSITEVIAGSSHGSVDHISLTSDRSFLILEFQGASFTTPVVRMA